MPKLTDAERLINGRPFGFEDAEGRVVNAAEQRAIADIIALFYAGIGFKGISSELIDQGMPVNEAIVKHVISMVNENPFGNTGQSGLTLLVAHGDQDMLGKGPDDDFVCGGDFGLGGYMEVHQWLRKHDILTIETCDERDGDRFFDVLPTANGRTLIRVKFGLC